MYLPGESEFEKLAAAGFNLIPVSREIAADFETPVSAFLKIADDRDYAFLLESVSGGEKWARYSFLGADPSLVMRARGGRLELITPGKAIEVRMTANPFEDLHAEVKRFRAPELPFMPRFFGGAVGYVGYEAARWFERLPSRAGDDLELPELCLMFTGTILAFDNVRQKIKIIANVALDSVDRIQGAYQNACERIERVIEKLAQRALPPRLDSMARASFDSPMKPNLTRDKYLSMVSSARDRIADGDVLHVAPSQRFSAPLTAHPFNIYRSLRTLNPSPYMFYLRLGDITLAGASPEAMVRVEGREVTVRPISGVRNCGATEAEDVSHEQELTSDPMERAEHAMLVDLARNDIGRVARIGSVEVTELMAVERYSQAMHMASNVRGVLRDDTDAFDAFRAVFPQGYVSGAPKIRAMEIIDEIEPARRGAYGGAIGYFSYAGNADTAIALRTMLVKDGVIYFQAGGVVAADSRPETEYEESLARARAMSAAIAAAHELENGGARE